MRSPQTTQLSDARCCIQQIQRELRQVNPSAARGLEEWFEETLTLHRLGVPAELQATLRTTNPIESPFSRVRTICPNLKRWYPGYQRWVVSGLIFANRSFDVSSVIKRFPNYRHPGDSDKILEGDQSGRVG